MSDPNGLPPPHDPPAGPRAPRGLRLALGISLALNLLVVGLIGGAVLGRSDAPRDAPALRMLGLAPFAAALPREARAQLSRRIEVEAPAFREARAEIGRGIRRVQRALMAEPYDAAELARALARSREAAAVVQARGHQALLATLEEMSPEERARVAERLGRTMRRLADRAR